MLVLELFKMKEIIKNIALWICFFGVISTPLVKAEPLSDKDFDIASWEIYRNKKHHFEVKYPKHLGLRIETGLNEDKSFLVRISPENCSLPKTIEIIFYPGKSIDNIAAVIDIKLDNDNESKTLQEMITKFNQVRDKTLPPLKISTVFINGMQGAKITGSNITGYRILLDGVAIIYNFGVSGPLAEEKIADKIVSTLKFSE